jgi:signal transduction histidine kinase
MRMTSNAIHYSLVEGAIQVTMMDMGASVLLEVNNRGPAIPAEVIPSLFDPFRRAVEPATMATPSEGLGLGLFIVQQIVQAHRGSIRVRSDSSGTTFSVELPRSP